jgi:hypothetical protein
MSVVKKLFKRGRGAGQEISIFRILMKHTFLACLFLIPVMAFSAIVQGKSGIEAIDSLAVNEWDVATPNKSLTNAFLWGLFPGGAQYYTGHYVRGGFLTALELGLLYEVFVSKSLQQNKRIETAKDIQDSIAWYGRRLIREQGGGITFAEWQQNQRLWLAGYQRNLKELRLINDKKVREEDLRKSELAWVVGLHLYGWMDGYGILMANQGRSVEQRSVKTAIWKSLAVPGWGQIYNDEYGKAGLLYMSIIGSVVSFNSRQNVVDYFENRLDIAQKEGADYDEIFQIDSDLVFFRKKRNQYAWGMGIIWIYSVADAAVDALLSDFDSPVHLSAAPSPEYPWVGLVWSF